MSEEWERFDYRDLIDFSAAAFEKSGMPAGDARLAAGVLIHADLMGIDSHGIAHLNTHWGYLPGLKRGTINPNPNIHIRHETPSTALLDGDGGQGLVVTHRAMSIAMEKAQQVGCGFVAVTNSQHFGAAGHWALLPTPEDMIGLAMTNTPPIVAPAYGRVRALGTNPIAVGVPAGEEHPLLCDIATSVVAGGKLEIAGRLGKPIPEGWAIDGEGNPTTDAHALRQGGALLPLGSTGILSYHKGYCLAAVVDVLCGVLSGLGFGMRLRRERGEMAHFVGAWRVDAFRPVAEFKSDMDEFMRGLRAIPPVEGAERVLVPGEKEYLTEQERRANGIPLDPPTVNSLEEVAKEIGIPLKRKA